MYCIYLYHGFVVDFCFMSYTRARLSTHTILDQFSYWPAGVLLFFFVIFRPMFSPNKLIHRHDVVPNLDHSGHFLLLLTF